MNKVRFFSVFALIILGLQAFPQQDTAFWFAPPYVGTHNNGDVPLKKLVLSSTKGARVEISLPAMGMPPQVITVPAGSVAIDLDTLYKGTTPANTVLKTGIYLRDTSNNKFQCFYEPKAVKSSDMFALKGGDALGTHFFIPGQNIFDNVSSVDYPTVHHSFDIVATENNTVVTITPKQNIVGRSAGVAFPITLNRGETFSCEGSLNTASGHLVGSEVTSTKPIAITVKDDVPDLSTWVDPTSTYQMSTSKRDLLGEQIVPVERVGTEYVLVKGMIRNLKTDPNASGADFYFVTATDNGTQVFINGNGTPVTTLGKGDTYQGIIPNSDSNAYIRTTKPAYVWHVTGRAGEVGGTLVPPMLCSGSKSFIMTRRTAGTGAYFYMNIVTMAGFENTLTWNGTPFGSLTSPLIVDFKNVPGAPKYKAAQVLISSARLGMLSSVTIASNAGAPIQLGVLDIDSSSCRYTYPTNFEFFDNRITPDKKSLFYCTGDTILLNTEKLSGLGTVEYSWIDPQGNTIYQGNQLNSISIPDVKDSQSGVYSLILKADSILCTQKVDSIKITISPEIKPDLGLDKETCEKDSVSFQAEKAYDAYLWSTGETTDLIWAKQQQDYILQVTLNGCKGSDTAHLMVHPLPNTNVIVSPNACYLDSADVEIIPEGLEVSCQIYHIGTNAKLLDIKIDSGDKAIQKHKIYPVGLGTSYYRIVLTSKYGCITKDSVPIKIVSPIINLGADTILCEPNQVTLTAPSGYNYMWSTGARTQSITVSKTDSLIMITITDAASGCMGMDTINVTVYPQPKVTARISKKEICPGDPVTVTTDSVATYLWTSLVDDPSMKNQTTKQTMNLRPMVSNTYYIKGTSKEGCSNTANVSVKVNPTPEARIDAKPTKVSYLDPRVTFKDISVNGVERVWNFGDGNTSTEAIIQHGYKQLDTATYKVILISKNAGGCSDTAYAFIIVEPETSIYIPNAFISTQEGKAYNEFKVYGNFVGGFEMTIFDRWGKKVFHTTDMNRGWDGTYNGELVSEGVYIYVINYIDSRNLKHMKKGSVTFIR